MNPPSILPLRGFGTLRSTTDRVDMPGSLVTATNAILRPHSAVRGPMHFERLWAMGGDQSSATFTVNTTDNTILRANHGLVVGAVVRFPVTGGTLPAPFVNNLDYYVESVPTSGSFTLAATLGGTAIDITTAGSGTLTYTATITVQALYRNLTFSASPVGLTSGQRATNKTIAVRHWRQGKHFLAFYSLTTDKGRGVFYMGDDGTYSGAYAFTAGTPSNEVLAVGLDADAMWFGARVAGLLMVQNGVDDPVAVQLDRAKTPGKWRKCASNEFPAKPTVTLVAPANDTNRQADLVIPGNTVFTADAATDRLTVQGKPLVEGLPFTATSAGTLPAGMSSATTYYVRNPIYTATSNSTTFQISLTSGGSVIDITDAGTGVHTLKTRTGSADLTFTIKASFAGGLNGNSVFKVAITSTAYTRSLYSTLSGAGTTGNPYVYTIVCGNAADSSSTDAIVAFVNNDGKVIPFITASKSAADATTDTSSISPALAIQNGAGNGVSSGFTSKTVTVYLTFFDTGASNYGYESPSSDLSEPAYILDTAHNDVLVTIPTNPSAEGGRFDKIRVYLQFDEGAVRLWNLMGDVDNTSGTKTLQIGSNTEIGAALSEFDQNRPLPHKAIVAASLRTWRGALLDFPDRLYVSKPATDDERAPEGVGLEAFEQIDVPDATVPISIRALFSDLYRLHVHTNAGIMIIDPSDPDNQPHRPGVSVGAINPSAFSLGLNNAILYIGADLLPYHFDGARYGRRSVKSAARDAEDIIRDLANVDEIGRNFDLVTSFQDKSGLLWWYFPDRDGVIRSMCLDLERQGLVGPFDYPKAVSTCGMEPERPEVIMQDAQGNLLVYDITAQYDTGADLPAVATFSPIATTILPPAGDNAWGYVDYDGLRYRRASWTVIETAFFDTGKTVSRKNWCGLSFRPVLNSRGIMRVTFKGMASGQSVTRVFGEMGQYIETKPKTMLLSLFDSAASVKMEILNAEGKPWILRDASVLYRG